MKIQVSDFIARYLSEYGVKHNFTIPGGGAMFLDDAFARNKDIDCIYVQHEQAASMAADAYYRFDRRLPLVCVTTGPGGTNTITGVLGAWLDSVPMLIISGQVRYATTARANNSKVRAMGDQEYDITPMMEHMTKYAVMVTKPEEMKYHLQKALYLATSGRPGPVWLDIPLDVQSAMVEEDALSEFSPAEEGFTAGEPEAPSDEVIDEIISRIEKSERPVINAGNAIRIAGAYPEFREVVDRLKIPVVVGFNSVDTIPTGNEFYVGRGGLFGDRPGNWAVQNSDLVLSIGSRLGVRQVGYNKASWARKAFVIMNDIDEHELSKPSIHVELPVKCDTKIFLKRILERLGDRGLERKQEWLEQCRKWRTDYPVVTAKHYEQKEPANAYCFVDKLTRSLPENTKIVVGNGSACVMGGQMAFMKEGTRFISNSGAASMGYDLPAAIGAAFANPGEDIICISGDGCIQMNLQELQTIVFHRLPVKLFVINNQGYHSMRQTESNLFAGHDKFGVGPESHDLSFPKLEKLAEAYGIPYLSINRNSEIDDVLQKAMETESYVMCEIFVDTEQRFEPKSATKRLEDGRLLSPPLEDLAPFLSREELKENMIIPLWEE